MMVYKDSLLSTHGAVWTFAWSSIIGGIESVASVQFAHPHASGVLAGNANTGNCAFAVAWLALGALQTIDLALDISCGLYILYIRIIFV